MCFYIHKDHKDKKVATRDMICYKRLLRNGQSPYKYFKYEPNRKYSASISKNCMDEIYEGLHSYSNAWKVINTSAIDPCGWGILFFWMLWLRLVLFGEVKMKYEIVVKFRIPKGARYYYNPDYHEYVSEEIIRLK